VYASVASALGEPYTVRSNERLVVLQNGNPLAVERPEPTVLKFKTRPNTVYILIPETSHELKKI